MRMVEIKTTEVRFWSINCASHRLKAKRPKTNPKIVGRIELSRIDLSYFCEDTQSVTRMISCRIWRESREELTLRAPIISYTSGCFWTAVGEIKEKQSDTRAIFRTRSTFITEISLASRLMRSNRETRHTNIMIAIGESTVMRLYITPQS